MKRYLLITAAILLFAAPAYAGSNVGISVSVGQPGFYGRIDIGNAPQPELVYAEPLVVRPAPVHVVQQPIYLHVPPGHEKKWGKHCHKYNACNRPVYFVRDRWYNKVYVPHHRAHYKPGKHDGGHGKNNKHGKHGKHDKHDRH